MPSRRQSIWTRDLIPPRWKAPLKSLEGLLFIVAGGWHLWFIISNRDTFGINIGIIFHIVIWMSITSFGVWRLLEQIVTLLMKHSARRAYSRRVAGRCVGCNYDLRGSTSPTCPECGRYHARM